MRKYRRNYWATGSVILIFVLMGLLILDMILESKQVAHYTQQESTTSQVNQTITNTPLKATIMASGDMLYHDLVYGSAFNGSTYDFDNDYTQITPLISRADLALGDFEGTISPKDELAGYPLFNAPIEVVQSIKNAGYDVIDLAHNHILDFGIDGIISTVKVFEDAKLETFGIKTEEKTDDILFKEVNGIKLAIIGYAYGYNGLDANLSLEEKEIYLKDLNLSKIKKDIEKAEQLADMTIIMPQMGEEYRLQPTQEQKELYHQMVEWGADIIFGGHPHVIEPTEVIVKDQEQKFIIYSMGNLLSNQRFETLENYWTERGVIMEVNIEKNEQGTVITHVKPHPTWVSRTPINRKFLGVQAYDYQVFLMEDYLADGQYYEDIDVDTKERIQTAYDEVMTLLNITFKNKE